MKSYRDEIELRPASPTGPSKTLVTILAFLQLANSAAICYIYSLTTTGANSIIVKTIKSSLSTITVSATAQQKDLDEARARIIAKAMVQKRIVNGMTRSQVVAINGVPDYMEEDNLIDEWHQKGVFALWIYSTNLKYVVHFDKNARVIGKKDE